ncbi:MAG TPA: SRPBCC family protein [Chryseosolibacter sp.]|nr:SRPBCC family protein [Chryseosolibacter sp.]
MTTIYLSTRIHASCDTCFDLSRSIDLHLASQHASKEEVIGGRKSGLLDPGESVTWAATHFGIRFKMTVKLTALERPRLFIDEMVTGPFLRMKHLHEFRNSGGSTTMIDIFSYKVPFGLAGKWFDHLFLKRHLTALLIERNAWIRMLAERLGNPKNN